MNESLVILGRQPKLGIAQLESLFGADAVEPAGSVAALLHQEAASVDFDRLGGSVKLCKLLTILDATNWKEIEKYLIKTSPEHAALLPEGKMHLGLSAYGIAVSTPQLLATGLNIKKAVQRETGKSVRLVPNKTAELNAAQVLHHKLTGQTGWELVLVRNGNKTLLAQTVAVQDIDGYAARDFDRPKRDAKVGMLPPKLAQIIVNLAAGGTDLAKGATILDPFCGTGVILQEAMLMGFYVWGSDLDPRMVEYTRENLEWLVKKLPPETANDRGRKWATEIGDATNHHWGPNDWSPKPDIVASETYLGRAFTHTPSPEILTQTITECNTILKKFLQNIQPQLESGTRLCLALPAWQTRPNEFKHLPLVDQIEELGYNQVRFKYARGADLLYYRPDQFVARELLVITRK